MQGRSSWLGDRAPLVALADLDSVCVACLIANHDLLLVRNGIVYARAAEHVVEQHFDGLAVVADSKLSYDKPIGSARSARRATSARASSASHASGLA